MSVFKSFISDYKNKGLKRACQLFIQKSIGLYEYQEQIKALQYFNNELHSPSDMPPTKDQELRNMQLCDTILLAIFDKICQKHNLTYWLDYGTLLGAVRHKGFIPWDDDMDVAMPRNDYEKIIDIVNNELLSYNFEISQRVGYIGLGFQHEKTGLWLDIFPIDTYVSTEELSKCSNRLRDKIIACKKIYKRDKKYLDKRNVEAVRNKIMQDELLEEVSEGINILYHGAEYCEAIHIMHNESDIFPLSKITFEGYDFFAPTNLHNYLCNIYGNNYMNFPSSGVLIHGEITGRQPLSKWASMNGVDMNEMKLHLERILLEL